MRPSPSARERRAVASRVAAAVVGGYVVTWLFAAAVALLLYRVCGMSRADAALAATMASFLVYAAAAVAVFSARSATRAWVGVIVAAAPFALLWLLLARGAHA